MLYRDETQVIPEKPDFGTELKIYERCPVVQASIPATN